MRQPVDDLLRQHGTSFAEEAGIKPADKPSALYRLLCQERWRAHLPTAPGELAGLVPGGQLPALMPALVRVGREH